MAQRSIHTPMPTLQRTGPDVGYTGKSRSEGNLWGQTSKKRASRHTGCTRTITATSLGPWLACRYPGPLSPDLLTGAPRTGVKLCTLTGLPGSETVLQLNSKKAGLSESTSCWANNWSSNEEDRVGRTPLEIEYLWCWGPQDPLGLSNSLEDSGALWEHSRGKALRGEV